jgi:hypothetical protein
MTGANNGSVRCAFGTAPHMGSSSPMPTDLWVDKHAGQQSYLDRLGEK